MNAALFSAAAAMRDNAQKMDTIVHNLANVGTTAYKRHIAMSVPFTRFLDETLEGMDGAGGEVFIQQHIRFSPCNGSLKHTNRTLDVALQDVTPSQTGLSPAGPLGEELFNRSRGGFALFAVKVNPRIVTRPREFNVDEEGYLVKATGTDGRGMGARALNTKGDTVKLPEGTTAEDVYIDNDGIVYVDGEIASQIVDHQVVAELDPGLQYTRNGNFHLKVEDGASYLVTGDGFRVQGENGNIQFDENVSTNQIDIDRNGRVWLGDEQVDKLRVVRMRDIPFNGELAFQLDEENFVINARGRRIVDVEGQFIVAPEGTNDIEVEENGEIKADGKLLGLTLERPGKLDRGEDEPLITKTRFGYYVPTDEFVAITEAPLSAYETHKCNLEQSNVNVVSELGKMIITMRSYEADARLLQSMERSLQMVTNAQG